MGIQLREDGVYVNGELKIPADKDTLIEGVYDKLKEDGLKTVNGISLLGSGDIRASKVLQTVFITSPNERYYYKTTKDIELAGLNTTITPKSDNSLFLVFATVNTTINYVHSLELKFRDKFVGAAGSNNTNQPNALYTIYKGTNNLGYIEPKHLVYAVENDSLDDAYIGVWYKDQWKGTAYAFYYNDRNSNDMRSLSHMLIMEVEK